MEELRDHLQTIYCPPLDSSLLAVFIADLETECNAFDTKTPSKQQISDLKQKLDELSAFAEEQTYNEATFHVMQSDCALQSISYSSEETPEWSSGDVTTTTSSGRSYGQFNSPINRSSSMEFLRAAFPDIDIAKLRAAIARSRAGAEDEDIDMGAIVEDLLTSEYILEMQERGLNEDDRSVPWNLVEKTKQKGERRGPNLTVQTLKKVPIRSNRITVTDVRQRQNSPSSPCSPSGTRLPPALDPWSQLTSLAIHLSTLLPSHPASYFQSAFHSPQHSTPSKAVRSCLSNIIDSQAAPSSNISPTSKIQLFAIFDILRCSPIYFDLNPEQRDQVLFDARLALRATQNNPDPALEIVEVLLDLDTGLDLGVYHTAVPTSTAKPSRKHTAQLSSNPTLHSPQSVSSTKSNTSDVSIKSQPDIFQWQSVPQRKVPPEQNTLAASIPAYNPPRKTKIRGSGNGIGKGGKGDIGELTHSERIARLRSSRDETLREATRYWKKGNNGNRGGEIAMYFADRARDIQAQAKSEALDVAREMVMNKRISSGNGDVVDMHGTTVAEAITIVKELLWEQPPSNTKPLKIITGRGTHSVGKTGVLKPAITNALVAEGWDVSGFDGGVIVRGNQ